ncbi:MAG TPA: aminotransferase class I/II-fold pyridoxal phosphate-dependent enzyme, partial [Candidatus Paceibacterota bacterium]
MAKQSKFLRVPYALAVFGEEERRAVREVLKTPQIVAGKHAAAFEQKVAKLFGKKHGLLVNSGSSANLLAFEVANLPSGSEVITPVLTFSTTVTPIVKNNL